MNSGGALPASARLRSVELFGSKVVPMVREMLAEGASASEAGR
jgi:hypothetical protein